ncbi:MAG: heparinase II/III-family protein [Verrucomicrobiae bacterium]|nr:heparinase II/III-family protein [Verrucomicrobiae bacterium]
MSISRFSYLAAVSAAASSLVAGEPPIPPCEHPRLYLRAAHAAQLAARLNDPVLRPVVQQLQKIAKRSPQFKVEWDALHYLVTKNRTLGRATIEVTLPLLQKCELPDQQDACRYTGRMMVTGAIVYDWCHALLSDAEKHAFIKELVRLAKTQECGYPPTRQGSVTGHASEAMIMRDMISAGIAIYDEFPEMYRLAAGRFFREHLPARNWFYNGHAYHQGSSYGPYRFGWDTFPLFIFDRLGFGNVYNPEQRFVPYLWVYSTRPDGQRMRAGDTEAEGRGNAWSTGIGTLLTASYYRDGVLLSHFLQHGGVREGTEIFEFLWRDTTLQPKPIESLPLTRYFGSPFGWMIARTSWGKDAVIAEMKINEYNFTNHQHMDAGAFQIYYQGPQAIDSGRYQGSSGKYGSPHCRNYYWRTIAHNALLIYDPKEEFGSGYGNDGGQRLPGGRKEPRTIEQLLDPQNGYRTGEVLAHGSGDDFAFLQGDITAAYSRKVKQVIRSFLFLNLRNDRTPVALIVFDRVVSANPAFKKFWLLHTLEEPQIKGASASADRLTLDVLLPTAGNAALEKVGGPGKEFWVFGANYENDPVERKSGRKKAAGDSAQSNGWRVEVSPKKAAEEDLFLAVMQLGERLPVTLIEAADRVGCEIANRRVLFYRDGRPNNQPVVSR